MHRGRRLVCLTLCLTALACLASPASAAQISQISWDVTGGTFDGPSSSGSITGGSVVMTFDAGTVSTPTAQTPVDIFLHLTGSTGFFSVSLTNGYASPVATGSVYVPPLKSNPPSGLSGTAAVSVATLKAFNPVAGSDPSATISGGTQIALFSHDFSVGNEVRTAVPEPSVLPLVGLGLLALGAQAGRRAGRRRRRA